MRAKCLDCGKEYERRAGDLGSYCPGCLKAQETLSDELGEEPCEKAILTVSPPSPALTGFLIAVNVVVFTVMAARGGPLFLYQPSDTEFLIRWGAQFGPLIVAGEWWRLLTCMFLHADVGHLGFNMMALWVAGKKLEPVGRAPFLFVYMLSGAGSSVASVLWDPKVVSVGASGAIFGLVGALVAPRRISRGSLRTLVLCAVLLVLSGALQEHVDYMGHLGGLVTGMLMGLALHRPQEAEAPKLSPRLAVATLAVVLAIATGAVLAKSRYGYLADFRRGAELVQAGKDSEAIPYLEHALELEPGRGEVHGMLGAALLRAGKTEEAIPYLHRAAQLQPADADWWKLLGTAWLRVKRDTDALAALERYVNLKPGDSAALLNLGLLNDNLGRRAPAVSWLKKAIEGDQANSRAHARLGTILLQDSQTEEAFQHLYTAVQIDPTNLEAQRNLGVAYLRRGQPDYAVECFEESLKLSHGDSWDKRSLAAARAALERQQ